VAGSSPNDSRGFALLRFSRARKQLPAREAGGETQMLALGRALLTKPRVSWRDEPEPRGSHRYLSRAVLLVRPEVPGGSRFCIVEQTVITACRARQGLRSEKGES